MALFKNRFSISGAADLPTKNKLNIVFSCKIVFFAIFGLFLTSSQAQKLIVVEKSARVLSLYQDGMLMKSFPCSLGWNPYLPKTHQGDGATPEGLYYISAKRPSKRYRYFLEISYPNLKDIQRAYWEGRLSVEEYKRYYESILHKEHLSGPLGNNIGVHGGGLFQKRTNGIIRDWTHGCIALKDKDIEIVYKFSSLGTPILIYDRSKSIFDIFREFVVLNKKDPLSLKRSPWIGEFTISLSPISLRLFLKETHAGARKLWIWGYDTFSGKPIFWIRDLNANGVLEPLDKFKFFYYKGLLWSYCKIQEIILQSLPKWVTFQKIKGREEQLELYIP